MSKDRPLVKTLSRKNILRLIKVLGLQSTMFDKSLYILEWDGLEYRFYIREDRLLLESVGIHMDIEVVPLQSLDAYKRRCLLKRQG